VAPDECYLVDDNELEDLLKPLQAPNKLYDLYDKFGCKWLSDAVQRRVTPEGTISVTTGEDGSESIQRTILERLSLLFLNRRGVRWPSLVDDAESLINPSTAPFSVRTCDAICAEFEFLGKKYADQTTVALMPKQPDEKSGAQPQGYVLYVKKGSKVDWYGYAIELGRVLLEKQDDSVIVFWQWVLSSPLNDIRKRLPTTRLLPESDPINNLAPVPNRKHKAAKKKSPPIVNPRPMDEAKQDSTDNLSDPLPPNLDDAADSVGVFDSGDISDDDVVISDAPVQEANISDVAQVQEANISDVAQEAKISDVAEEAKLPDHEAKTQEQEEAKNPEVFQEVKVMQEAKIDEDQAPGLLLKNISISDILQQCKEFKEGQFIQKERVLNRVHHHHHTITSANMSRHKDAFGSAKIPLFVNQGVEVNADVICRAEEFAGVLSQIARQVFGLTDASHGFHMFLDTAGSRVAFNSEGSIFFNLRHFTQYHAPPQSTPANALIFWFVAACNVVAYKNPSYDTTHDNVLENLIVMTMPSLFRLLADS